MDYTYTKYPEGTAEFVQDTLIAMLDEIFVESGNQVKERDEGYEIVLEPVNNGKTYINPDPGNPDAITEGERGFYCTQLMQDGQPPKNVLILNKDIADQIVQKSTMQLLFDDRNIIVGVVE